MSSQIIVTEEQSGLLFTGALWMIDTDVEAILIQGDYSFVNNAPFEERTVAAVFQFGGKTYIHEGYNGAGQPAGINCWSTVDGINWVNEPQTFPVGTIEQWHNHSIVEHNGKLILAGVNSVSAGLSTGKVYESVDGNTWTQIGDNALLANFGANLLSFNGDLYKIGGTNPSSQLFMKSVDDGVTWTDETIGSGIPTVGGHSCVVFDNKMWIIAGNSNSNPYVFSCSDGINWVQHTHNLPLITGIQHAVVEIEGELWLTGGFVGSSYQDKTYSSKDAINWTESTLGATFPARRNHVAFAIGTTLFVTTGYNGFVNLKDVWSSDISFTNETKEIQDWTEEVPNGTPTEVTHNPFTARQGHASAYFLGKHWILGGDAVGGTLSRNLEFTYYYSSIVSGE